MIYFVIIFKMRFNVPVLLLSIENSQAGGDVMFS